MSEQETGADAPPKIEPGHEAAEAANLADHHRAPPGKEAEAAQDVAASPPPVIPAGAANVKADTKRIYQPCPCGTVPEQLFLEVNQDSKVGRVTCGNCGAWGVDFLRGHEREQEPMLDKAQAAWDAAPRPSEV